MKIETIRSDAPRPLAHYNEAVRCGEWIFAAGQIASDYKTGVPPEARRKPGFPYYGSDIKLQTRYIRNRDPSADDRLRPREARSRTWSKRRCF